MQKSDGPKWSTTSHDYWRSILHVLCYENEIGQRRKIIVIMKWLELVNVTDVVYVYSAV